MKRIDNKEKQDNDSRVYKRASLAIFVSVILLFAAVMFATEMVDRFFGKTAGTIALVIIAAAIAIILYRKEIAAFFKKNRS